LSREERYISEFVYGHPSRRNPGQVRRTYGSNVSRRSIKEFDDRTVEQEKVDEILMAAGTAPMDIPPSNVEVLVISGKKKVREFSDDILEHMKTQKWIFSKPALILMRPIIRRKI
jgi:hypothetical protein